MSGDVELEPLLRALDAAFKSRGMLRHVDALRACYAERIHKRERRHAARLPKPALEFTGAEVVEWARARSCRRSHRSKRRTS